MLQVQDPKCSYNFEYNDDIWAAMSDQMKHMTANVTQVRLCDKEALTPNIYSAQLCTKHKTFSPRRPFFARALKKPVIQITPFPQQNL